MKKQNHFFDDAGTFSTSLDPNHPNYDALLLKRARLNAHRRRRAENKGAAVPADIAIFQAKDAKKKPSRRGT